jgi:hypothetical protein
MEAILNHLQFVIDFIKDHYEPATDSTADLELTTSDLYDIIYHHLPGEYGMMDIYELLAKAGFTYGNQLSSGIRFVWYLKKKAVS